MVTLPFQVVYFTLNIYKMRLLIKGGIEFIINVNIKYLQLN